MTTSLSVVLPAWNEAGRLAPALRAVAELRRAVPDLEALVVDDGSDDQTAALAEAAGVRTIRHERNRGKGAAVRTGMLAAVGERRLFCDVDQSTPLSEVHRLLAALDAGADVAVGVRDAAHARGATRSVRRAAASHVFRLVVRPLRVGVADPQCGFKAFTAAAADALFRRARLDRYAFDVELLVVARRLGLRVAAVPVAWEAARGSRLRLGRDGARMAVDLARIAANELGGVYR